MSQGHLDQAPIDNEYLVVSLDPSNEQMAISLAGRIAAKTGRAVAVLDAKGDVVLTIPAANRN